MTFCKVFLTKCWKLYLITNLNIKVKKIQRITYCILDILWNKLQITWSAISLSLTTPLNVGLSKFLLSLPCEWERYRGWKSEKLASPPPTIPEIKDYLDISSVNGGKLGVLEKSTHNHFASSEVWWHKQSLVECKQQIKNEVLFLGKGKAKSVQ
jgi:hypothetical protein